MPTHALKMALMDASGKLGKLAAAERAIKAEDTGGGTEVCPAQWHKHKTYKRKPDRAVDDDDFHQKEIPMRGVRSYSDFMPEACYIEFFQNVFDAVSDWLNHNRPDAYRIVNLGCEDGTLFHAAFHAVSPKGAVDGAPGLLIKISDTECRIEQIGCPLLYSLLLQNASCAVKGQSNADTAGGKGDGMKSAIEGLFAHYGICSEWDWKDSLDPETKRSTVLDISYTWRSWLPDSPKTTRQWDFEAKKYLRTQTMIMAVCRSDKEMGKKSELPGYPQMITSIKAGAGGVYGPAMSALRRFTAMYHIDPLSYPNPKAGEPGEPERLVAPPLADARTKLVHAAECFRPRQMLSSPTDDPDSGTPVPFRFPGMHLVARGIGYPMGASCAVGGEHLVIMIEGRGLAQDTPHVFVGKERTPHISKVTPLLAKLFRALLTWSPAKAKEIDLHNEFYSKAFSPVFNSGRSWLLSSAVDPLLNETFKMGEQNASMDVIRSLQRVFLGRDADRTVLLAREDMPRGVFAASLAPKAVKVLLATGRANPTIFPTDQLSRVYMRVAYKGKLPEVKGAVGSRAIEFVFGPGTKLLLTTPVKCEAPFKPHVFRVNCSLLA